MLLQYTVRNGIELNYAVARNLCTFSFFTAHFILSHIVENENADLYSDVWTQSLHDIKEFELLRDPDALAMGMYLKPPLRELLAHLLFSSDSLLSMILLSSSDLI